MSTKIFLQVYNPNDESLKVRIDDSSVDVWNILDLIAMTSSGKHYGNILARKDIRIAVQRQGDIFAQDVVWFSFTNDDYNGVHLYTIGIDGKKYSSFKTYADAKHFLNQQIEMEVYKIECEQLNNSQ